VGKNDIKNYFALVDNNNNNDNRAGPITVQG